METNPTQSLLSRNLDWLNSNLHQSQLDKLALTQVDVSNIDSLSDDDFHLEYTSQLVSNFDSPRKISLYNIPKTGKMLSKQQLSHDIIGSTEFTILDALSSQGRAVDEEPLSLLIPNYILIGSYTLPAVLQKITLDASFSAKIQSLILIESSSSNFLSSLQYFDFAHFIACLKKYNIAFQLIFEENTDSLIESTYHYIARVNPFLVYGLNVVPQPRLIPSLVKFEDWLFSQSGVGYRYTASLGFTTDEINQTVNSLITYKKYPSLKGIRSTISENEKLTVVTGSGPSLDSHLDWLKANNEKITIYAAGSSVQSLLAHNIKPSYLVVNERNPIVYDYLVEVKSSYPELSDITFVASDTIDSRSFSLFDKFLIYQRPGSAVSPLFSEFRPHILPAAGPESVNACFESALTMGCTNILLLGCDFASYKRSHPRSKNAFGLSPRDLDIPVSGNRKRTVFSQLSLLFVRDQIERAMAIFPSVNVIRSGEGAALANENYIDVDLTTDPLNLLLTSATSDISRLPSSLLYDASQIDISAKINSIKVEISSYLNSLTHTLDSAVSWSLPLEQSLSAFIYPELQDKNDTVTALAAKRILRHCIFHLLHQLYHCRHNQDAFSVGKQAFIAKVIYLDEILNYFYSTLDQNFHLICSADKPLSQFRLCLLDSTN